MQFAESLITKVAYSLFYLISNFSIFIISIAICLCPDGYTGQPSTRCVPFECNTNQDCDFDKKCVEGSCKNPCLERQICGVNAQCRSENHEANCVCLPNYVGDAKVLCDELKTALCQPNSCGINAFKMKIFLFAPRLFFCENIKE